MDNREHLSKLVTIKSLIVVLVSRDIEYIDKYTMAFNKVDKYTIDEKSLKIFLKDEKITYTFPIVDVIRIEYTLKQIWLK